MNLLDNHHALHKFKQENGFFQKQNGSVVSKYIAWSNLEKKLRSAYSECASEILKKLYLQKSKITNRVITTVKELTFVFEKYLNALSNKNNVETWAKVVKMAEETDYVTVISEGMTKYIKPRK